MRPALSVEDATPRPSRMIAEALVQRHGPRRIATRAARCGFSSQLTNVMVVACAATALRPREEHPRAAPVGP